ncbi:hypothetical protein C0J52_26158 [Blattella germanica]|nr:hypothetical protein C0J52_26158 [Blattella germanica]
MKEHSMQEMVIVLEAIVNEFGHLSVDDSDDNSNTPSIAETVEIGSTESQSLELLPVTPPPSPLTVKRSASATIEGPHELFSQKLDKVVTTTVNSEDPWNAVPIDGGMREKVLNKQMTYIVPTVLRPLSDSQRRRRSSVDGRPSVMIDYVDANMFRVFVKSRRFPVRPEMVKYYVQECRKKKTIIKEHSTIRLSLQVDLETLHNQLSQDIMSGFRGFLDAVDSVVTIDATTALQNNDDWSDGAEAVAGSAAAESIRDVVAEVVAETGPVESTQDAMLDDNLIPSLEERCSTPECPSVDEQPCCSHDISRSGMSNTESDDAIHQRVERVKEWERFIRPNLKRAHERGYFDIHAIGSEILEAFPECNTSRPTVTFHQLTADKPKEDIARYFLATLQLANTYNVKISKSVPGVLSMDCMQLTLLSSSRHHEALEEYEAPSKSERRKRRIHTSNDSDSDDSVSESDNECDHRSSRNKRKRTKR